MESLRRIWSSVTCDRLFLKVAWVWLLLPQIFCGGMLLAFDGLPCFREVPEIVHSGIGIMEFGTPNAAFVPVIWGVAALATAMYIRDRAGILSVCFGMVCVAAGTWCAYRFLQLGSDEVTSRTSVNMVVLMIVFDAALALTIAKLYNGLRAKRPDLVARVMQSEQPRESLWQRRWVRAIESPIDRPVRQLAPQYLHDFGIVSVVDEDIDCGCGIAVQLEHCDLHFYYHKNELGSYIRPRPGEQPYHLVHETTIERRDLLLAIKARREIGRQMKLIVDKCSSALEGDLSCWPTT